MFLPKNSHKAFSINAKRNSGVTPKCSALRCSLRYLQAWHTSLVSPPPPPPQKKKTQRTSSLAPRYVNSKSTCKILNREGLTYTDILQTQLVRFIVYSKAHFPRPLPATKPVCFAPIPTPLVK